MGNTLSKPFCSWLRTDAPMRPQSPTMIIPRPASPESFHSPITPPNPAHMQSPLSSSPPLDMLKSRTNSAGGGANAGVAESPSKSLVGEDVSDKQAPTLDDDGPSVHDTPERSHVYNLRPNRRPASTQTPRKSSKKPSRTHASPEVEVAAPATGEDRPEYVLRLAVDYGTINTGVSYHLASANDGDEIEIEDVRFDGQYFDVPMVLRWMPDDTLDWGHTLDRRLERGFLKAEDVIQKPKLVLYSDYGKSPPVMLLDRQIRQISTKIGKPFGIVDLVQLHLKSLVQTSIECIKRSAQGQRFEEQGIRIAEIPVELHLSVPQAWDPSSNNIMAEAAKSAGFNGQLVLEPQCVAAFVMHNELKRRQGIASSQSLERAVKEKKRQLVIDAGGGTVDLAKYEMSLEPGAKCKLKTIGNAKGELIGSAILNEDFADAIVSKLNDGSLKIRSKRWEVGALLEEMNLTEHDFRHQLCAFFESHKKSLDPASSEDNRDHTLTIRGAKDLIYLEISTSLIRETVVRGIRKVLDMVDNLIDDQTTTLILSGGFGRSAILRHAIETRYKTIPQPQPTVAAESDTGDERRPVPQRLVYHINDDTPSSDLGHASPVTRGALLRHYQIDLENLPASYSYFTVQDEDYDHTRHLDALQDPDRQKQSHFEGSNKLIVWDRIANLVSLDDRPGPEGSMKRMLFSYWFFPVEDKRIVTFIYWSRQDLTENAALQDYNEGEDYRLWRRVEVPLTDEILQRSGYDKPMRVRNSDKGQSYRIYGRILLKVSGAEMKVGFQIGQKGKDQQIQNLVGEKSKHLKELWEEVIWTSNFSHVANDTDWVDMPERQRRNGHVVQLASAPDPTDDGEVQLTEAEADMVAETYRQTHEGYEKDADRRSREKRTGDDAFPDPTGLQDPDDLAEQEDEEQDAEEQEG